MNHSRYLLTFLVLGAVEVARGPAFLRARPAPPTPENPRLALTLEQAIDQALAESPSLQAAQARVARERGVLVGARVYPYNPELELEGARRQGGGAVTRDAEVALAQQLEIAGQRSARVATAQAKLAAAQAQAKRTRRLLVAEVRLAYVDALEVRERLAVAQAEVELARQLLNLAERRLQAGAGTQLDVNVASAEVGRAEQALGLLQGRYAEARARLAEVIGLSAERLPVPGDSLVAEAEPLPDLASVLAEARRRRADLEALRALEQAAEARERLARRSAWPDLRVGLFGAEEESRDLLVGVRLAIPIPIFQRNQGEIAQARAERAGAAAEARRGRLEVSREVVAAYERYRTGLDALGKLNARVLGTVEENLELLVKAFEAGKARWAEVLVMRRSLFEVRRALIETSTQVRRDRVFLDLAAAQDPFISRRSAEESAGRKHQP